MSTLSKSLGMIALGLSVSGCAGDITHGSLEASSIGAVLQNPQTGQTVMLPDVPGRNPRPADENTRRIMSGNFAPTDRGDRFTDLWNCIAKR